MNRNGKKTKSSGLLGQVCKFLMVLITAGFLFNLANHHIEKQKMIAERDALMVSIVHQQELTVLYKEELDKVGTDEYYEYMARKYLGYIYPDEKVLIYDVGEQR